MASQKKTRSIKYKENTIHAETDSEFFYNLCKTKNAIKTLNCKNDEKLKKNSDDWKYRNFRRLKEYKQCFE